MVLTSLKCNGGRCPFGCNCSLGLKINLVSSLERCGEVPSAYNECFDVIDSSLLLLPENEGVFDELE